MCWRPSRTRKKQSDATSNGKRLGFCSSDLALTSRIVCKSAQRLLAG
jgi:hypothetical protein